MSVSTSILREFPRLPLDGYIDLTYRCNNACRHCWLWLPQDSPISQEECSADEIKRIVSEARQMGCQAWRISGGEPMLRHDFVDIFEYISHKAVHYSLNTNGTLITPEIARLMIRKGNKMVAIYGATSEVHDNVTRTPGSFEAMMRGTAYLREAGAGFVIQIVPMKANYHQYQQMLELAKSLSPHYRIGAPWLWFTACQSSTRNREISRQRLDPHDVISIETPDPTADLVNGDVCYQDTMEICSSKSADDRLFAACIASRRDFHIDPYGGMSFCCFIKDPALRYNLKSGTFKHAWDEFIPSLADIVRGGDEYQKYCGTCKIRRDCRWCGVYGYLEHGRYSAKVDYLCQVAEEVHHYKKEWKKDHIQFFRIAEINIRVITDFPIHEDTFSSKFDQFKVAEPSSDVVTIKLFSSIPRKSDLKVGKQVYNKSPWKVYAQRESWIYLAPSLNKSEDELECLAIFNHDYHQASIYRPADFFKNGRLGSLTTFPTDQILISQLLADRQGIYLHASGMILNEKGFLFVGHSEAGKSTMMKLLKGHGEILCDDRIIVRLWPDGFHMHGTWSHGELPEVSPASIPLHAIMYLEKANKNVLIPINTRKERLGMVLNFIVKPLITADWWKKTLDLAGKIASDVPAYRLQFDLSGQVVELLNQL